MEDALSDEAFLQNWMGSPSTTATKSAQTSNSAVMAAPLSAIGRCNVVHEAPVVHEVPAPRTSLSVLPPVLSKVIYT